QAVLVEHVGDVDPRDHGNGFAERVARADVIERVDVRISRPLIRVAAHVCYFRSLRLIVAHGCLRAWRPRSVSAFDSSTRFPIFRSAIDVPACAFSAAAASTIRSTLSPAAGAAA